jgi:hypothetical protein
MHARVADHHPTSPFRTVSEVGVIAAHPLFTELPRRRILGNRPVLLPVYKAGSRKRRIYSPIAHRPTGAGNARQLPVTDVLGNRKAWGHDVELPTKFSEKREGTNFIAASSPLAKVLAGWVYPSSDPLSFPGCSLVSPLCPPLLLALVQRESPRVSVLGSWPEVFRCVSYFLPRCSGRPF